MATLNIPSTVDDPNYRYKMPKLRAKIEGKGNGIKTNIYNMSDIARALKRSPEYVTKFCGHELGSQSKYESNEGKAIVNGAHFEHDLQALIDKFCEKFVLCPNCHLPEIDLVIKSRVRGACNACGFTGDMDNAHKLATYIIKNPPAGGGEQQSTMGKKGSKKSEKAAAAAAGAAVAEKKKSKRESEEGIEEGGEEEVGEERKHHHHHHKKHHHKSVDGEKTKKKSSKKSSEEGGDAGVAASGISEESEKRKSSKRHQHKKHEEESEEKSVSKKSSSKKQQATADTLLARTGLNLAVDEEEVNTLVSRLAVCLKDEGGGVSVISPSDFFRELRLLQVSQEFGGFIRAYITFASIFPTEISQVLVKEKVPYLKAILDRSVSQTERLNALAEYFARVVPKSLDQAPFVLSELYQQDILEEDDITSYFANYGGEKDSAEEASESARLKLKEAANSFLTWLEGASSAGDSDDDEDEDEEEEGTKEMRRDVNGKQTSTTSSAGGSQKFKSLGKDAVAPNSNLLAESATAQPKAVSDDDDIDVDDL